MKILYLSCHAVLEYDELRIFHDLGFEVFSHGAYHNPKNPDDKIRPPLDLPYFEEFSKKTAKYPKENLQKELIDWADVIICVHKTEWLYQNLENLIGKKIIFRSIGQNVSHNENILSKLRLLDIKIVRYSPYERTIIGYAGEHAIIRFAKKPEDFLEWSGQLKQVITFGQSFKKRRQFCGYDYFILATKGLPAKIYGPNNEDCGELWGGYLSYEDQIKVLSQSAVYFYTGTYPASYTLNFIEAAMAGCPMVALGNQLGNAPFFPDQKTYEVADLLSKYEAGVSSDNPFELHVLTSELLEDKERQKKFSRNIKNMALELFDYHKIKKQWDKFLKNI